MKEQTMLRYLRLLDLSRKRSRGEVADAEWISSVTGAVVFGLLRAADIADDEAGQIEQIAEREEGESSDRLREIASALSAAVDAALSPAQEDAGAR